MRYTQEQVDSTSKLMVEAYYKQKTVDEAMEEVYSKKVAIYKNFKIYVKNLEKLLSGGTVHLATPCNWADATYKYLTKIDKLKYLDAMQRQVEYDDNYGSPSHKLRKWIEDKRS